MSHAETFERLRKRKQGQLGRVARLPVPARYWHGWMRSIRGGLAHAVYREPDGRGGWLLRAACHLAPRRSPVVHDGQAPRCLVCLGHTSPTLGGAA